MLVSLQPCEAADGYMKFSFERDDFRKYGLGLYQVIHAEGPISEGTAGSLRIFAKENKIRPGGAIYFQSRGGDLSEAIRLGRVIRELGLNTYIGGIDSKQPGYCLSACTLAYLGGVFRFMDDADAYSVQRFYRRASTNQEFDLEASRVAAEEITAFVKSMGVNAKLFQFMLLPGSEELVSIDKNTLVELRAVNDGVIAVKWEIADKDSSPHLRGIVHNNRGTHKMTFICDRQNHTLSGTGFLESSDPQAVKTAAHTKGIFIDKDSVEMDTEVRIENNYVELPFPVSPELAERLLAARELGIYFQPQNTPFSAGFTIRQTDDSKLLMKYYFKDCLANTI